MSAADGFLDLLIAAMSDAAVNGKLTQLKTQIDADGKGLKLIRLVVIPERMDHEWPQGAPFGARSASANQ
jgi:hypothetical protein